MANNIYISARTQFDNLGDALINKVLFDACRANGELHLDCKNVPSQYMEIVGKQNTHIYNNNFAFYKSLLKSALRKNLTTYILKPGHIFTENDSLKSIFRDLVTILIFCIFNIFNIKIKRFGASIGPFTKISCFFEKIKTCLSETITYRDHFSQEYLTANGFKNVEFCPDLLFYPEYASFKKISAQKPTIAFSFRSSPLGNHEDQHYMRNMQALVKDLAQSNLYNLIAISQVTRDQKFQTQLIEQTNQHIEHYIYDGTVTGHEKIIQGFRKSEIIISNRLHALLNGAIYGVNPLAFVTPENWKVIGVLKSAKMNDAIINANEYNFDDIKKHLMLKTPLNITAIKATREQLHNYLKKELSQ